MGKRQRCTVVVARASASCKLAYRLASLEPRSLSVCRAAAGVPALGSRGAAPRLGEMAEPPREAAAIVGVLRAQGAPAWEPRVVAQLLEFSYRHVADVLDGAQQYAAHRSRDAHITQADVRLAAQSALTHTFTEPLAGEELARIVAPLNAAPLPPLASRPGVVVPAEGALLATNFQARPARDVPTRLHTAG